MERGAWPATVLRVSKESDGTERLIRTHRDVKTDHVNVIDQLRCSGSNCSLVLPLREPVARVIGRQPQLLPPSIYLIITLAILSLSILSQ